MPANASPSALVAARLKNLRTGWRKWCNQTSLCQCKGFDQRAGWELARDANERGGNRPAWSEGDELDASDLPTVLWMDLGGRVSCPKHIGTYAIQGLEADPTASSISTPITTWSKVKIREDWMICESCASKAAWAAKVASGEVPADPTYPPMSPSVER